MKKIAASVYGVVSYLVGLSGLTAFMLYMGSWDFLPIHVNSGMADDNTMQAVVINLLIVLLFGLHHTIAARKSFKEKLATIMPAAVERSSYILVSGIFMFVVCLYWQPLPGTLWATDNEIAVLVLKSFHVIGWLVLVAATFEIDHFHLMGLKQSFTMSSAEDGQLKERFLYRIVRHPIQTGFLIGMWSTPHMSMTQFMLAGTMTVYIFVGLYYEERSLEAHFGDAYRDYKKRVPRLIPFWPTK